MTPSEYVLSVMQAYPDNEMTTRDLFDWQTTTAIPLSGVANTLQYLHRMGKVVKSGEGKAIYWSLAPAGMARPLKTKTEVAPMAVPTPSANIPKIRSVEPAKPVAARPVHVIRNGRW